MFFFYQEKNGIRDKVVERELRRVLFQIRKKKKKKSQQNKVQFENKKLVASRASDASRRK
jgi:hypothetical protein